MSRPSQSRRDLLKGGGALLAAQLARPVLAQPPETPVFAYVGSFTTAQRYARGDGIHVYRVEEATARWTDV
jgi:6-phosphogluconolactonase